MNNVLPDVDAAMASHDGGEKEKEPADFDLGDHFGDDFDPEGKDNINLNNIEKEPPQKLTLKQKKKLKLEKKYGTKSLNTKKKL